MGPADMDEPGSGHGHAPGSESPPERDPASDAPGVAGTAPGGEAARPVPEDVAGSAPEDAASSAPEDAASSAPEDAAGPAAGSAFGDAADSAAANASDPAVPGAAVADPVEIGHRPSRKKKILAWTAGGVAVVVLLALGGAYAVYRHLNGNIHQVNISGELGTQPVDTHPQAENIMVIGSDTRNGQGGGFGQGLTTDQSDTLMIMHVSADRKWVDVMSIPRDSWVNIPACKMGNGHVSAPTTYKINEAFALGNLDGNHTDLGVACTIKTLEQDTGIHIDHFVAINFSGFQDMVNALGGVEECNTTAINDPKSDLYLKPGHHLLHGFVALAYVRARYTLGNGSDLERIGRQQAFMSSLVNRVKSKLLNPVAIYKFLDAATKSITVDSQLGGIHGLYDLATSVKNLPASQVTFFTLPTYPRQLVVPTDTANVMWTQPEDSTIFQDFRNDVPVTKATTRQAKKPRMSPHTVSVSVRNGTAQFGLQDSVGSLLQQKGFNVTSMTQESAQDVTETVIKYHAGHAAQARLLEAKVPGSGIQEVPGTSDRLVLVLGSNYGTTTQTAGTTTQGTTPSPSPSLSSRTASQNICAN
jgi:LCP family protein required for cell wall assembly